MPSHTSVVHGSCLLFAAADVDKDSLKQVTIMAEAVSDMGQIPQANLRPQSWHALLLSS